MLLGLGCVGLARILQLLQSPSEEQWPHFSNFCLLQLPAGAETEPSQAKTIPNSAELAPITLTGVTTAHRSPVSDRALNNLGAFCRTCGLPLCKEQDSGFARRKRLILLLFSLPNISFGASVNISECVFECGSSHQAEVVPQCLMYNAHSLNGCINHIPIAFVMVMAETGSWGFF